MQKWIITAVGIFIIGTIFSLIASGVWFGSSDINVINKLAGFSTASQSSTVGSAPTNPVDYWNAMSTIMRWDYPYLDYSWCVFIKIPLWLISIGVVWGFIEVMAGIVQGILGALRSVTTGGI